MGQLISNVYTTLCFTHRSRVVKYIVVIEFERVFLHPIDSIHTRNGNS